jgi:hypothetical protein
MSRKMYETFTNSNNDLVIRIFYGHLCLLFILGCRMIAWESPEIPSWMNNINSNSTLTFKEIAPIFKRPIKGFRQAFLLRFDCNEVVAARTIGHKRKSTFGDPKRIKMSEIRELVYKINNGGEL